jgi:hypothetical protein
MATPEPGSGTLRSLKPSLATLFRDVVDNGGSVGFLLPLAQAITSDPLTLPSPPLGERD